MKLRTFLASIAAAAAALTVQTVHARSIPVDANITCSSAYSQASDGSISLGGSNSANIGFAPISTLPVYLCNDSLDSDTSFPLPFTAASSPLYTWIDSTQSSSTTVLGGPPNNEFSFLSGLTAQVAVLSLSGSYLGDTEVQFNYDLDSSSNCPPTFAPTLTWGGQTYTFTGAAGTECGSNVISDFLFGSNGNLLGYVDASGTVQANGQTPFDWSSGSTTSVAEPATLALAGCALFPVLLLIRRRVSGGNVG